MRTVDSKPVLLLWALLTLGLPAMLLYSAVRTYNALEGQKAVYLRSRMAAVASRLETLPAALPAADVQASLEDEPGLLGVEILAQPEDSAPSPLAALWRGEELFRTEVVHSGGKAIFRAFVPFHGPTGLRVARIDLAADSADFLVEHARHHLWIVSAGALLFVALSSLAAWTARRLVRAREHQSELEHLAHIGTLAAVLAHEIRNPLGTIKGFAQLLEERAAPEQLPLLRPIVSETVRLEGLVKDLLLYGRPLQVERKPARASDIAGRLSAHAVGLELANGLTLQVADVAFETDSNLLEQALLNLLRNAAEALRDQPGAICRLECEVVRRDVVWRVIDNGPGLSAEARTRLFEPFYTTKSFGSGLGLSITRKLARSLGGGLRIGDAPGGGTRAELWLPLEPVGQAGDEVPWKRS